MPAPTVLPLPTGIDALALAVTRLTAEVDRLSQRLDAADLIIDGLVAR
jgi:hypothetical protein